MSKRREGGYLISQIHQLSGRIFSKKLKDNQIDLNHAQGRIIFALWKKDEISISELAKETALSKSTLTTMLERLEISGHLLRTQSDIDKRNITISLTEKSKELKLDYQGVTSDMVELFYKGFTDTEIEQFETYLQKILTNLKSV